MCMLCVSASPCVHIRVYKNANIKHDGYFLNARLAPSHWGNYKFFQVPYITKYTAVEL